MLDFIKDRIALILLLIAGDGISLIAFVKAPEIRVECTSMGAAIALLLSLIISLAAVYLPGTMTGNKRFMMAIVLACMLLWVGFIVYARRFSDINNAYGAVGYPSVNSRDNMEDSVIVGGCAYTREAQKELDNYKSDKTLTLSMLLSDFNYETDKIWSEASRDCARKKIIFSFSAMIAFLVAGITLSYEFILLAKKASPVATRTRGPERSE